MSGNASEFSCGEDEEPAGPDPVRMGPISRPEPGWKSPGGVEEEEGQGTEQLRLGFWTERH